jgi:hypothetical protein
MAVTKKSDIKSILNSYGKKLNKEQQFYHILQEIKKHDLKLKKLKIKEDRKGHFKEEVCDVFILSGLLMELEGVSQKVLNKSSRHFAVKVKEIYSKNSF